MNIYTFGDLMTCFVESYAMLVLLETFFKRRENFSLWIYRISFWILAIMFCISNGIFGADIMNSVGMSVSTFIISALYRGLIPIKLLISVLGFLFIVAVESIVLFLITIVYGIAVNEVVDVPLYRLLGIILSKTFTVLIVHLVNKKLKSGEFSLSTPYWISFLIIFANSIVSIFLIFKLSYDSKATYMYNMAIICSFGSMFCILATLFLYERLTKQTNEVNKQKQIKQHSEFQQKHIKEILVTQRKQARFRHDITEYLVTLAGYFEAGDNQAGLDYINNIEKIIKSAKESVHTGNTAFDAILNHKIALAEEKEIKFVHEIQVPVDFGMEDCDISVIFGNALDNAIEACNRLDNGDKTISFKLFYAGDSLLCKIVNSSPEVKSVEVTSKADKENHGLGIESIRMSLEKYDSEPHMEYSDGKFTFSFMIMLN